MLRDAYVDLKYLLNRGYRKSYALEFVANHYRLTKKERHLLARCVFSDGWIREVEGKLLKPEELVGKVLAVDGFNVLITLESLLDGKAILCEDGLIRDLKYQGRYRINERTGDLLTKIAMALKELGIKKTVFFYGKNVPGSGEVKRLTEEKLKEFDIPGEVKLVKSPDFELKAFEVVATADVGIIVRVPHVFDLAGYVGEKLGKGARPFVEFMGKMCSEEV
ncbi:DUF434 domain-containing protein [Thermococcus sp. GR7]|uniref:DUF434 domain-containing protein n=1 Tax=unclassified Thermococcus TaxID=2627626 RepID=UPI001430218B|nr:MULTISPECIES: DUF434 domain-containing protein [unclassified Thermococcus]NJE45832.1 DUF434 domain-containing protein [Thermococcus sp. GR7]NJE79206.1 DUF434 domain-containing protein [Thermococcus sp. GR4]NJF22026.1 DUF434 domain-containing protein [Thermococcus sp. GR5]